MKNHPLPWPRLFAFLLAILLLAGSTNFAAAQPLEQQLLAETPEDLVADVLTQGDAKRGAVVFHLQTVGCSKCHSVAEEKPAGAEGNTDAHIAPNLAKLAAQPNTSDREVVLSILNPSATIRKGFEALTVLRTDGTIVTGLKISAEDDGSLKLRDASTLKMIQLKADEIEETAPQKLSIMPAGVVNTLAGRQQFLDLAKYVLEIRDGGVERAQELQPPAALIAFKLPEYEAQVDHAGLIRTRNQEAFARGEAIYSRLCVNCHGTLEQPGSLPTALRFGQGKFRNGSDPYAMYRTLTHGFGLMVPQTWMVPQQKYDVIHYIRESILKDHNPSQYRQVDDTYLASLPKGSTFGPEPVEWHPWSDMDYGPWMFNTVEVSQDGSNIAYKGLAVRLDPGPGGVSRGNQWMLFDHDTMRVAAAWSYRPEDKLRFIDWRGIHFDGRHQAHPHVVGDVLFANPTGPGWANPESGSFDDDQRVLGRDDKRYGPLPDAWAKYHGMHHAGNSVIVSYRIGDMEVLEQLSSLSGNQTASPVYVRTLELGPTSHKQSLLVATDDTQSLQLVQLDDQTVCLGGSAPQQPEAEPDSELASSGDFTGDAWLQIENAQKLDMATRDFSITARVRTKQDGVIFANTEAGPKWIPDGTAFFIRGGKLCYDIGWVGVIQSKQQVADGQWHDVALTWTRENGEVRMYVDGEKVASGSLSPKARLKKSVARIGFGAPNFPRKSAFSGSLRDVRFFQRTLAVKEVQDVPTSDEALIGSWLSSNDSAKPQGPAASVVQNAAARPSPASAQLLAGIIGDSQNCKFAKQGARLCLNIPPSPESRTVAVWLTRAADEPVAPLTTRVERSLRKKLSQQIEQSATPLWPEKLTTFVEKGEFNRSGFAVDILTPPDPNPWLARIRLGGLDFHADGNRMIICTWDGDVFEVSGLAQLDSDGECKLTWRRIASGLFQPLGVKIVDGDIYLTCRDQLVILRDRNGDGATDFYECFNNDQQVTEHFHEFAMGLQRDEAGNFYYAKSARHALPALVPHHGTLLRVPPDGSRTDILAVGFRAANGVCLNPDGSYVVTDQEGHWNPKNRINWVVEGGFYGNMYGYHDVTDESDDAMEQPLCWITNAFDRSPAELLWVDSPRWGNLNGTLLNLSYGYGKVYTVPHEHLAKPGRTQGGMCELPIPQFPTGIIRGRFSPTDGQLYVCGLFAWASSQQAKEGGIYRIRYQREDAAMPVGLHAGKKKLEVTFSDPLAPQSVADLKRFSFKVWGLQRTKNYGSKHIDEHPVPVTAAELSADGRTLTLTIPELAPTWSYELRCRVQTQTGQAAERVIHGTIHELK